MTVSFGLTIESESEYRPANPGIGRSMTNNSSLYEITMELVTIEDLKRCLSEKPFNWWDLALRTPISSRHLQAVYDVQD
jgi:hypothetical protein